jgi:hypothetical protein
MQSLVRLKVGRKDGAWMPVLPQVGWAARSRQRGDPTPTALGEPFQVRDEPWRVGERSGLAVHTTLG